MAGVLSLIALLVVPLAFRGHGHADHTAARPCALCMATAHTPLLNVAAIARTAPVLLPTATAPATITVVARLERPAHAGRAPPRAARATL